MTDQERLRALLEDWAQVQGSDDAGMLYMLTHFIMVSGNTDRLAAYLRGLEEDEQNEEGIWP